MVAKPTSASWHCYNETHSLRPKDYANASRNASYLIGLILWARAKGLIAQ